VTARASDSMFYSLTLCALQIVFMITITITTSTIRISAEVGESVIPAPVAMTSPLAPRGPLLLQPITSFFRDSDQITASEAMLVIEEWPRVPQLSVPWMLSQRLVTDTR